MHAYDDGSSRTLDLWILDDGADLLERLRTCLLHLDVRVGEHLGELGHDAGQAVGELFGRAVRHRSQQLDGAWWAAATRQQHIST